MKTVSDLGERKLIQMISTQLTKGTGAVGIGDDCAAVERGEDYLLITTDMISQKTHIPPGMTPYQIGWFVVAINLSDIAAKGGKPIGVVVSLGLPKKTSEVFIKQMMRGANTCATQYGTRIIGGDTKENPELTLCGTAIGVVKKKEFIPRRGARPGDLVVITGALGKAGAGYVSLQHHIKNTKAIRALCEPIPRIVEGQALAKKRLVSSCMDISDGLSSSLYQLQELNPVGFEIHAEKIPVCHELVTLKQTIKRDIYDYVLHFGGDYELLFTLSAEKFMSAVHAVKKTGTTLTAIGTVTKEKTIYLVSQREKKRLLNQGYEHFKNPQF